MKHLSFRQAFLALAGFTAVFATPDARAIIFLHGGAEGNREDATTSDTNFNATRPVDDKGIPWDSVGFYNGGGGGTAISSRWFISATHVGNGGVFTLPDNNPLNNDNYNVVQDFNIPGTDVSLHRVDRDLPSFTKLYTGNPLTDLAVGNTPLLLIGDGFERGAPKIFSNVVLGWDVGGARAKRWALNNIDIIDDQFDPGDPWWRSKFAENIFGNDEGMVTPGDSGGGAFVKQNGEWRLLGPISYAITLNNSFFPWATIDRIFNTQQGLVELSSESAGYLPSLSLDTILAHTDLPDPRMEAVPEVGTFASASALLMVILLGRARNRKEVA